MKKSITVNANQEAAWNAILSYRTSDPDNRKVRSIIGEKTVIEEVFGGLPVFGSALVVYEESDKPFERIDFQLVEGDKISQFEGAWTLTPSYDGSSTEVELLAKLDIEFQFPFKEQILNAQAEKDMDKRLQYVKRVAER